MLKTIMTALLILVLCAQCVAGINQFASPTLGTILWWLPENTETLIVARGPYALIDFNTNEAIDLRHTLQAVSYGPLALLQDGKLLKPILGQTVLLSVEGSRKFCPPSELGSMKYEGCHLLVFGQGFVGARDSFIRLLETQAKEVQKIAGHQVLVFEEKFERDLWRFFIVSPRPDVVLCATDQGFLTEVLNRMELKAKNRALPESLPEWKHVDTTAQFWAVRHYDIENAWKDTTSPLSGQQAAANEPDRQAIGITLTYNPVGKDEARMRYLSANTEAAPIASKYWNPRSYKIDAKVSRIDAGVVEIVINPDSRGGYSILLLLLLAAFGHAIYV